MAFTTPSAGTAAFHTFDLTAALVEVADHITHVFFGRDHVELHHRLHKNGTCLGASVLVSLESGDFERKLVRVHGVERTVEERYLQLIQRIACEDTVGHSLLEALLYRGDEFLRHVTALDFVYELQIAFEAFVGGLYTDDDVSELTATTRLLLVDFTELNGLRDSFLYKIPGAYPG